MNPEHALVGVVGFDKAENGIVYSPLGAPAVSR